jgi:hypothetical protein
MGRPDSYTSIEGFVSERFVVFTELPVIIAILWSVALT